MENKINIAELLKDCPKGMELDCIIFNNPVKYESANDAGSYPISIRTEEGELFYLNKYGCLYDRFDSKCAIFPKGKTTWEGFQRPFEDGDIVSTNEGSWIGIVVGGYENELIPTYCAIKDDGEFEAYFNKKEMWAFDRLATEEEKEKLFKAIKENGYKWNAETKTLEKLIEPKFKVGDRVRTICGDFQYDIKELTDTHYTLVEVEYKYVYAEPIIEDKNWELVHNKFDITTLKPFDKVLVKSSSLNKWHIQLFEKYDKTCKYPFICMGYNKYMECIPYEQNEHLLDTTDDCDEYYKTW